MSEDEPTEFLKQHRDLFKNYCFKFKNLNPEHEQQYEKIVKDLGGQVSVDALYTFIDTTNLKNFENTEFMNNYDITYILNSIKAGKPLNINLYRCKCKHNGDEVNNMLTDADYEESIRIKSENIQKNLESINNSAPEKKNNSKENDDITHPLLNFNSEEINSQNENFANKNSEDNNFKKTKQSNSLEHIISNTCKNEFLKTIDSSSKWIGPKILCQENKKINYLNNDDDNDADGDDSSSSEILFDDRKEQNCNNRIFEIKISENKNFEVKNSVNRNSEKRKQCDSLEHISNNCKNKFPKIIESSSKWIEPKIFCQENKEINNLNNDDDDSTFYEILSDDEKEKNCSNRHFEKKNFESKNSDNRNFEKKKQCDSLEYITLNTCKNEFSKTIKSSSKCIKPKIPYQKKRKINNPNNDDDDSTFSEILFDDGEEHNYNNRKCWWLNQEVSDSEACKIKNCKFEPNRHKMHKLPRRVMSLTEKQILLKYLIMTNSISEGKGIRIWELMIDAGYLKNRTKETLRNCLRRTILKEIESYGLPPPILNQFLLLRDKC